MDRKWTTSCGSGVGVKRLSGFQFFQVKILFIKHPSTSAVTGKHTTGKELSKTDEIKREKGEDNDWITITFFIYVCMCVCACMRVCVCVDLCVCLCEF